MASLIRFPQLKRPFLIPPRVRRMLRLLLFMVLTVRHRLERMVHFDVLGGTADHVVRQRSAIHTTDYLVLTGGVEFVEDFVDF